MRIQRLRIKNIASLKGEHEVDFEAISAQSGLFAITGETGAGKSTILNSIGLALYGKIYKSNVNQIDVVTLGEKEGLIELKFEVAGTSYVAEWRAKLRAQNGEPLKKPQTNRDIFLLLANGSRGERIESIEELLQMDFEQFTKCVILNQGEFARFLSSSFTERKDILDKLYPGEFLDNLGKELKRKKETLEQELSILDSQLSAHKDESLDGPGLKTHLEKLKSDLFVHESWLQRTGELEGQFVSLLHYRQKYAENLKKIELNQLGVTQATSKHNLALKETQIAHEAHEEAKARLETQRPHLQELLKIEEASKIACLAVEDLKKKIQEIVSKKNETQVQIMRLQEAESSWKKSHKTILEMFQHNPEELKILRPRLEKAFDLFVERNEISRELENSQVQLKDLEETGKSFSLEISSLEKNLKDFSQDLPGTLILLEERKNAALLQIQKRQKTHLRLEGLEEQLRFLHQQAEELKALNNKIQSEIQGLELEFMTLEAGLKLQELQSSVRTCLTHAEENQVPECPVCHSSILPQRWSEILGALTQTDTRLLKSRSVELFQQIEKQKAQHLVNLNLLGNYQRSRENFEGELVTLREELTAPLASLEEIEFKIKETQKMAHSWESLKKDEARLKLELQKTRESWSRLKSQLKARESLRDQREREIADLELPLPLNAQTYAQLKAEMRELNQLLQSESTGGRISQEIEHLLKNNQDLQDNFEKLSSELKHQEDTHSLNQKILEKDLGTKSALEILESLGQDLQSKFTKWNLLEKELNRLDHDRRDFQRQLSGLEDLQKELELEFFKAQEAIREGSKLPLPYAYPELEETYPVLSKLNLKTSDPFEIFIPLKESVSTHKERLKHLAQQLRMEFASVKTRLEDWQMRQEKMGALEKKKKEVHEQWIRKERLSEVLGKDELRSFVLSLVEENLILHTNEELQKLCQGRYEIIHQTRGRGLTQDFYVLDKFREGIPRKVSTLSGGETFMVSLAMAVALAEMTRGQAEIGSLFIDEGFGTLDQDSLEDVLDMLHQIQTRGLMVGVISHIKALTSSIPVNLVLNKRSDGTSQVGLLLH